MEEEKGKVVRNKTELNLRNQVIDFFYNKLNKNFE